MSQLFPKITIFMLLYLFNLVRSYDIINQYKQVIQMLAGTPSRPQRLINYTTRPQTQQYQINNQQNYYSLTKNHTKTQKLYKQSTQFGINQEVAQSDQANKFIHLNSQGSVSLEQYRAKMLDNQYLKLTNKQLQIQLDWLKKSKNSSQCTQDEQIKKQQDMQETTLVTPKKIKLINQAQFSEKMTVESKKKRSEQQYESLIKQVEEYKLNYKNQQRRRIQYSTKLQESQRKKKQLQKKYEKTQIDNKKLLKKKEDLDNYTDEIIKENNSVHQMLEFEKQNVKQLQKKLKIVQGQNKQETDNLRQQIIIQKTKVQSLQEQLSLNNIEKQKICKDLQAIKTEYKNSVTSLKNQVVQKYTNQNRAIKKSLEDKISQKENQIIRIQSQNKILQSNKRSLQATNKTLESTISKLKQQNNKIKSQIQAEKVKLQTQIKQKQIFNTKYTTLEQQFRKQQEVNQKERKEREAEKQKIERQFNDLKNKFKQSQQTLTEKQKQYAMNIREKEDLIAHKHRQNLSMMNNMQKYRSILKPIYQISNLPFNQNMAQETSNLLMNKMIRGSYFQQSTILNEVDHCKTYFLFKQLSTFLSIPTFKSQMLFKFDPINPHNNCHKYITGINNIMVLIKLVNGTMVGGFTVYPFEKEVKRSGKGFIFSLTAQKSFKMKKQPKVAVTTSDPFFLIIGNSQLRIKFNQTSFFSNFGVAAAIFDNNGFTKQEFLGIKQQNVNEVDFQTYEIYAIHTDQ